MKVFFLKKVFISLEFLLILFWIKFYSLNFFSIISEEIKRNLWVFLGGAIITFGGLTYKLTFPEQDKKDLLKKYPELNDLELVINISIFYFILFATLMLFSLSSYKYNLPALGGFGLVIVIFCQSMAFFSISQILRRYS